MKFSGYLQSVLLLAVLISVAGSGAQAQEIMRQGGDQSGMPFLTQALNGTLYLSWIDPLSDGSHALRFSRWNGKSWDAAETISTGKNWFVNWADTPSIAALPDGSFLAHWLSRSESGGKYGYGIQVAQRSAQTQQWKKIHGMSLDQKEDYAGFLRFVPGKPAAIYLSPPQPTEEKASAEHHHDHHEEGHRKTVRFISFQPNGLLQKDHEVDADACSCCPTAVASTPKGLIAAYRDHLPGEIRDISVIRLKNGKWSEPAPLHRDGWKINGCPTEGPSIATQGSEVGIIWLTRANAEPRIQIALSHDAGGTFEKPVHIDEGDPLGRPSVVSLPSGGYLSLWMEKTPDAATAEIRLRKIDLDGKKHPSKVVASVPASRASGIPRIALNRDQIIIAWRNEGVRTLAIPSSQF